MIPHEFLRQQTKNVERALAETLRYDYGPKSTWDYYQECRERLARIELAVKSIDPSDLTGIEARLDELSNLSVWISLIERSRLGEFSWPFAEALRRMAEALLAETALSGATTQPIVHVVADGEGYFIHYEGTSASSKRKFAFIAFPRPLKHHVLLRSIFGHELGHTALHSAEPGNILQSIVMPALQLSGPMSSPTATTSWLHDTSAPPGVKKELSEFFAMTGTAFEFDDYYHSMWLDEFICDLFGLLLFGPAFAAAHQVYLRPMNSNPYEIGLGEPTHPPYSARHKMLVRLIKLLGWDQPISIEPTHQKAEQYLVNYVVLDQYDPWSDILTDQQLTRAINGVNTVFRAYGKIGYEPPNSDILSNLLRQLTMRLPPVVATLKTNGLPELRSIDIRHTLYAGWVYSLGSRQLTSDPLPFLETNMLCDLALLQQRAIDLALEKKIK